VFPALLVWGGAAREARAVAEPAPIRIDVEGCPPGWETGIRQALAVELGDERLAGGRTDARPAVPDGGRADDIGAHTLSVRCEERRVQVAARDAKTAVTLERTLNGDLPEATGPRLIALVAVELLTTFDPALRRRRDAPAKPIQVAAAASAPSFPPQPALEGSPLFLTVGGVYRTFFSNGGVHAWGGALDARRASRGGRWSIGLGVEIADGERSTIIGQTSALFASASATAGVRARLAADRLALSFEIGGRGGAVRMSGQADNPSVIGSTVIHPWAGPVATLRAELGLSWFCAEIAAEGGWAAVAASGNVDGGPVLAASGPWLALSLGVGQRR
jgi:hypothetical protein